jgi:hypothetical protein
MNHSSRLQLFFGCCILHLALLRSDAFVSTTHKSTRRASIRVAQEAVQSSTEASFLTPNFSSLDEDYPSPLHSIHVRSILSDEETAKCLQIANEFAAATSAWDKPDADRHATYATCDFPVEECETLGSYLKDIGFNDRIWGELSSLYGVRIEDMTYLDFFCSHYEARTSSKPGSMDRLEAHRDGTLLSFTVVLTPPDQFEGGGTFFDALRDVESPDPILQPGGVVRPLRAGDVVLHGG